MGERLSRAENTRGQVKDEECRAFGTVYVCTCEHMGVCVEMDHQTEDPCGSSLLHKHSCLFSLSRPKGQTEGQTDTFISFIHVRIHT